MSKALLVCLALLACLGLAAPAAWAETPWSVGGNPWWDDSLAQAQTSPWQGRTGQPSRGREGVRWVRVQEGRIPSNALEGGQDKGQTLYVCRAKYQNGTHVGKVLNRRCNIGWGGREIVLNDFEVLVQRKRVRWVQPGQMLPKGAVFAGRCPEGDLYVCRGRYRDGTQIGKLFKGKCNIGWGGKEVTLDNYQVLVAPEARWLKAQSGQIPSGAVGGGHESNTEMYVCRGYYKDGEHPGKLLKGRCNIGWGGQEIALTDYDVLVQPGGLSWLPQDQARNRRCVVGGQEGQEKQCVCRGDFRGGLHPGKVWKGRCNIGWGGQEFPLSTYEVLVTN